jgi:YhcH/YjgK/YiaL family protein
MMKKILFLAVLSFCLTANAQMKNKERSVSEQDTIAWFEKGDWKEGFNAQPAPSVDKLLLYAHYKKHPERWQKVFSYLKNNDLLKLPLGNISLDENIIVKVQEYTTHEFGDQKLEAHRKYIDFQYVITGCEFMGSGKLAEAKEVSLFDEKKDWGGYYLPILPYYVANSAYFFIFFPQQVHLTNLQVGDKAPVRKIVFKIKVD